MEELDLKEIFYMFWNRKIQIICIVVLFFILGIFYTTNMVKPNYKSSTTLILAKVDTNTNNSESITQTELTLNQKLVSTYSELVKSKSVLREVIDNLGVNITEEKLASNVSISLVNNTELIKITVSNEDPKIATNIANEIAKVFSKKVSEIYNINNVHVVDRAEEPKEPYNINHIKDIIMVMAVGIVVAVIYVFVANLLDTTVKTAEDIERHTKLTVLSSIPKYDATAKIKGGSKK